MQQMKSTFFGWEALATLVSRPWKKKYKQCIDKDIFNVENRQVWHLLYVDRKETATDENEQEHREASLQVQQWERCKDIRLTVTGRDSQRGRQGGRGGSSNVLVAETEEEGYFYILLLEMWISWGLLEGDMTLTIKIKNIYAS